MPVIRSNLATQQNVSGVFQNPEEFYVQKLLTGQIQRLIAQQISESKEDLRIAQIRAHYDQIFVKERINELEAMIMKLDSSVKSDVLNPPTLCFTDRALRDCLFKLDVLSGALNKLTHSDFDFYEHRSVQIHQDILTFAQEPLRAFKYANVTNLNQLEMPLKVELATAG